MKLDPPHACCSSIYIYIYIRTISWVTKGSSNEEKEKYLK